MSISKEQWDGLTNTFTYHSYAKAEFKYQEHSIIVYKVVESAEKNKFKVFINDEIKGEWYDPKSANFNPIVKLFWNHINSKILSKNERDKAEKLYGKREFKIRYAEYYERRHDFYLPSFTSLKKLINQFKKIEGLEITGGECI